ncbi:hypothetical protein QJS04_geneDACA020912 [Acorus gramineus]|uniref:Fructose-2,6-bisphosphatase n=1 Tax=Acorus gramineus TaxID=55184 RepID=A0AAV9B5P1_ACOGR|nr:hypothetical protein QJS04_geneDACA020912 [Acorus gramineus]
MGQSQSSPQIESEEEEDEEEDDEEEERKPTMADEEEDEEERIKVLLSQEPEILPCHASASPLSPQLSSLGTPRIAAGGGSIKVWDPCNVLSPPLFRASDGAAGGGVEVYLVSHGESGVQVRPDLVAGRWTPAAAGLTHGGERQARALAVFLKSQGVGFDAVYCSPLDRARSTAGYVCRELNFAEDQIQSSESLVEMSNGQWEGCLRSEIYTPELLHLIERTQPDFSAPSGESLRQVEFRMVEFLNRTVLRMPEKLNLEQGDIKGFSRHSSTNSVQDREGPMLLPWDGLNRPNRPMGITRRKSGKSRLQFVTTTGDNEIDDDLEPNQHNHHHHEVNMKNHQVSTIGIFTHATPIKCLLTGILNCSPVLSQRICIDDSSVTVLQHSMRTGWQIKRLNDTAHLRLL